MSGRFLRAPIGPIWLRVAVFVFTILALRGVPGAAPDDTAAAAPGASNPAAGALSDTLGIQSVLDRESGLIDSLLTPEALVLDTAGVDSVAALFDAGGLAAVRAASPDLVHEPKAGVRFSLQPGTLTAYNRVEGFRPGLGFSMVSGRGRGGGLSGLRRVVVAGAAGYGLARERWVGRGELTFGKRRSGPAVRLWASDLISPFGGRPGENAPLYGNGALALVAGQDRQDYLRRRGGGIEITPWRTPGSDEAPASITSVAPRGGSRLTLSLFHHDESPVISATDFHFFGGGTPMEEPNPPSEDGITHGAAISGVLGSVRRSAGVAVTGGVAGGALGGDFDFSWQEGRVSAGRSIPGGAFSVSLGALHVGGTPPYQDRAFLGGDATLRGYDRLQFAGETRAAARVEYAIGADILGATGIPLVRALRIRFIPFADAGTTWGEPSAGGSFGSLAGKSGPAIAASNGRAGDGSGDSDGSSLDGEVRTSTGLGLRRDIWIPAAESLRLDVIHRNDGAGDPWSFWLRIESLFE